eukprot:TRINITY_DN13474_c0_g1_i1.p1 TRINITY_DN13474_c0_g1~~TRINITY_DN13474_c0_g1_i1.p1  ORF type:complete len:193 (-),score=79.60 TRINITY_DN13474_c0_g1_i1:124-702(-)
MSQRELEGNWEISVSSPSHLEVDPALMAENQKLTPRQPGDDDSGTSTISMDECWMINIKAPASLNVERGKPDDEGFQETVISECEEEKGNFLCGPEWKVRITTKADQLLDVKQIEDGEDFRVLISPLPPKKEEKVVVKTAARVVEKKVEKKVVKVEVKKGDERYLTSGGKIFFHECPLYHKAHPWIMPLGLA